ncbi:MAG: hypothetical protein AB7S36_17290, partial [Planctomycetota bacterium]
DTIESHGCRFTIVESEARRVKRVKIEKLAPVTPGTVVRERVRDTTSIRAKSATGSVTNAGSD